MEVEERSSSSDFGNLLRRHRLTAGLSQEALAERARMSSDGISALERGHRRTPQRETLALLAGALALDDEERREFQLAASRPSNQRLNGSVTVGLSGDAPAASLPLSLTNFVGRERELDEIAALIRQQRFVTITGAGGVGKTQTALRVASALGEEIAIRFIGLAPITDPSLVVAAIASSVGVGEAPSACLLETVSAYLRNRAMLLILDNCEHVITEVANVLSLLLLACQRIRVIATSREPIRAAGEYAYWLPSLDGSAAAALFADRARAVVHHFEPTAESAPIITEICLRLDGIPLAIELAAARVNLLSLNALAEKLEDRFQLLTGGDRTALRRHQTMRAAIQWSYDLLSLEEQRLFERLSVFTGGCTLAAAIAVCVGKDISSEDIFGILSSLVDKSLVVVETTVTQTRYSLLQSTAAYAMQRLRASGGRQALERRHAKYFKDHVEAIDKSLGIGSISVQITSAELELELDNCRSALEWALTRGNDVALGAAMTGALQSLWVNSGVAAEGRHWVELALERLGETKNPQISARLWLTLARLLSGRRSHDAAERAIQLYESVGNTMGAARAQSVLATALFHMAHLDKAWAANSAALEVLDDLGDKQSLASCLGRQASIERCRGNALAARDLYAKALAVFKMLDSDSGTAAVLGDMAENEFEDGHPESALPLASEALELLLRGKNATFIAAGYLNIAAYHIALGNVTAARESVRQGLNFARRSQDELLIAISIQHLALLAGHDGDVRRAALLLGYVDARYAEVGMEREHTERWAAGSSWLQYVRP